VAAEHGVADAALTADHELVASREQDQVFPTHDQLSPASTWPLITQVADVGGGPPARAARVRDPDERAAVVGAGAERPAEAAEGETGGGDDQRPGVPSAGHHATMSA